MIHELKIELQDPKGARHQLNLKDYNNGYNGSVQVRFGPKHRFTVSSLGRQSTILVQIGERQVALPVEELTAILAKAFGEGAADEQGKSGS